MSEESFNPSAEKQAEKPRITPEIEQLMMEIIAGDFSKVTSYEEIRRKRWDEDYGLGNPNVTEVGFSAIVDGHKVEFVNVAPEDITHGSDSAFAESGLFLTIDGVVIPYEELGKTGEEFVSRLSEYEKKD